MPTCPARRNLPLALALAGGLLLAAAPCRAGVDCGGTLQAWRQDAGMRQYMQTHQCDCSNGNSNMPVCTSTSSGSSSSGSAGHGRSSSQYSTKAAALKGIQDGLNQSLTIDYGAIERSNQKQMDAAQRLEDAQLAAQQAEEARRLQAAQEAQAARGRTAQEIGGSLQGLPESAGLDFSAVNAEARRKPAATQGADQAACKEMADSLARLRTGVERAEDVMAKNEVFIREAEAGKKEAVGDATQTVAEAAGGAAIDAFQDRLQNFIKAKNSLQGMKKGLDELEKTGGLRKNARKLTPQQIKQAREWVDKGMEAGGTAADLTDMTYQYATAAREGHQPDPTVRAKLLRAVDDFNDKFMNDAGGWEFAGEHLAEYGGGPAGKLAFKAAVIGIKLQVAAIGYGISARDLAEYRRNQAVMEGEVAKLRWKIQGLKDSMASRQCPPQ